MPEELERQIDAFVHHCNSGRYHESMNSLTPHDVFAHRGNPILKKRAQIKEQTMLLKKRLHSQGTAV